MMMLTMPTNDQSEYYEPAELMELGHLKRNGKTMTKRDVIETLDFLRKRALEARELKHAIELFKSDGTIDQGDLRYAELVRKGLVDAND